MQSRIACPSISVIISPEPSPALRRGATERIETMATFVLLTKLSPERLGDLHGLEGTGRQWMAEVKAKCPEVKFVDHYALLGPFDFMDIYEAPNEETAAKVSMITMSKGAVKAESWTALPYKRFLKIIAAL
jgi:uncharacterized protein with GYD domain